MAENYGSLEGTLDAHDTLEGEMNNHSDLTGEIQFTGAGGRVKDVQVNDVSVVDANKVAHIDLTPYAEKEDVYDKQTIDTALEGKADTDDIPTELSDLQDDADHRLVTDAEKTEWSGKSNVSANPSTTTETLTGIEIDGTAYAIPSGSGDVTDVKVNDTSVVDENGVANIDLTDYAEKSDLGTASALDVAVSGDASTSQVVKGDDTRLTDARPASDVNSWAKASTKPDYTASEVGAIATTAKGTANGVAELDENGKVPSAQLPSYVDDVLEYASVSVFPATGESGKIYIALDTNKTYRWSGTTYTEISESLALGETDSTAYAGNKGKQNADNIAAIQGLIPSSATTSNKLATASDIPDISGKADKSEMSVSTSGDQTTIQLKNGTSATVLNAHQSITGKADKVTNATENNFAALDANGNLKDSGHKHSDYLTQHQDISGKADKVTSATNGNLAGLNGSGNPTDSGWNGAKDTTSISGNPISIPNLKANQLAVNPIITLEPIQAGSGTPSPSNIRAISGYDKIEVLSCGKNVYADGNVSISDTAYVVVTLSTPIPAGTYKVSAILSSNITSDARIAFRRNDGTGITAVGVIYNASGRSISDSVILPETTYQLYFYVAGIGVSGTRTWSDIMITPSDASQTYSPYNKATSISESLGQTVYGGSLDVRTGKFTVTHGIKDMGDVTWYLASKNIFYSETDIGAAKKDGITSVCSCYLSVANVAGTGAMSSNPDKSIALMNSFTAYNRVYVKETSYSDATAFKTAVTGQKLVYELATPFTIQLTPHEISLLKDYAYVSTNGTTIVLDYHNGELASLADVAQLSETLEELDRPQERTCQIDITSYTSSSNRYTIPFDGYITASLPASSNGDYLRIYVYTHKGETMGVYKVYADTRGETLYTIAVKKGMKAMMTISTGYIPTVTFRGMA